MPNLTDADKVLRNDTGKDIVTKLDGILNAIEGTKQSLENLSDVNISNPTDKQALLYDATSEKWDNESLGNAAFKNVDTTITSGSSNPISSGAVNTGLSAKMDKTNPTGTGSFSLNRKAGTTVGNYSHAEGYNTTASGAYSHAEGYETTALGDYSHAEGYNTTARGNFSHAEGSTVQATGHCSHAEGYNTGAGGNYSHAEGAYTAARGVYSHVDGYGSTSYNRSQHVFGEWNGVDGSSAGKDERGNYIEIVGNGTSINDRSTARSLDWSGNEMIAGDLTYNGNTSLTSAISDVNTRIDNLPEPMVFKGSLGTGGTITTLPVDGSADKGWTYKVIEAGTYAGQSADMGDTFICDSKTADANTWTLIPSGDEPSGTVTSIQIQASSPINIDNSTAITTSGTRTISHANSGVTEGNYGDSSAQTPAVGGTFKVPYVSVNATGHITNINAHNVTMPVPTATDVTYDNTTSGLSATNTQSAIDEIKSSLGVWLTGTLMAGQTTLVLSDTSITTDSIVDNVYVPDTFFGVNPTSISATTGSVTLTFPVQSSDLPVKVRVF